MSEVIIPVEPTPQTLVVPHPPQEYLSIPDPSDGVITETPADSVFVFSQNADDEDVLLGVVNYEAYLMSEIVVGSGGGSGGTGLPEGWTTDIPATILYDDSNEDSYASLVLTANYEVMGNVGFNAYRTFQDIEYYNVSADSNGFMSNRTDDGGSKILVALCSAAYGTGGYIFDAETETMLGSLLTPTGIAFMEQVHPEDDPVEARKPPATGVIATREALTAGEIPIPFSAIISPVGHTFRGPWREYGEVVRFVDFTDEDLSVIHATATSVNTTSAKVSDPTLTSIDSTTPTVRPALPEARVVTTNIAKGSNNNATTVELNVSVASLGIPSDVTITRLSFFGGLMAFTGFSPTRQGIVDGTLVAGTLVSGQPSWQQVTVTSGLGSTSNFGFRATTPAVSNAWSSQLGITGITVYGTREASYNLGDSVSYNGKIYQSVANANNDKPGETLRWVELIPLGP